MMDILTAVIIVSLLAIILGALVESPGIAILGVLSLLISLSIIIVIEFPKLKPILWWVLGIIIGIILLIVIVSIIMFLIEKNSH